MESVECKGCGLTITADDEAGLVERVQAHIAEAHPSGHAPTADQVRAVIEQRHLNSGR